MPTISDLLRNRGEPSGAPAEMKATPRSDRLGFLADALRTARDYANKVKVPEAVPLFGGQGLAEAVGVNNIPEEINEWSYGNSPLRINPNAGRTNALRNRDQP